LACGNTVVLKASEICPGTHRLIAECLREAGLPPGVLNVITNAPEDAPALIEALISHPAVRRINFTGSTRVGRIIAQIAAKYLKPVLLELGGKAPLLVLDDADIDAAVAAAAFGAFMNQGQICMSTERIVVDAQIADAFVAKLAAEAGTLVAGDPRTGNMPLGSMIGMEAAGRIQGLIKDAVGKGARVVAGGKVDGTLMSATVVDHVTSTMRIYGEESFGPHRDDRPGQWRGRGRAGRQRHRVRIIGRGCLAATLRARSMSQSGSSPASAMSTGRRCMMKPRCHLAA
jgi:acyl-CoA reductase-like NAD-dependent aldehyde dehydrogenase